MQNEILANVSPKLQRYIQDLISATTSRKEFGNIRDVTHYNVKEQNTFTSEYALEVGETE